ncbi:MAG: hypothetical protein RLZZ69_3478 [Cyanobacteriota bacterium]|jgi:hypothetical protein
MDKVIFKSAQSELNQENLQLTLFRVLYLLYNAALMKNKTDAFEYLI